jgi:hypothetical protein
MQGGFQSVVPRYLDSSTLSTLLDILLIKQPNVTKKHLTDETSFDSVRVD